MIIMNKKNSGSIVITKDQLVRSLARRSGVGIDSTRLVINMLEDILKNKLSQANEKEDVIVKLFEGVSFQSKFIPAATRKNNLTGEIIDVDSKIKPKVIITKTYCNKLNSYNDMI